MLPALISAMCACTWHFFYNSEDLLILVALQAFTTFIGNIFLWYVQPVERSPFLLFSLDTCRTRLFQRLSSSDRNCCWYSSRYGAYAVSRGSNDTLDECWQPSQRTTLDFRLICTIICESGKQFIAAFFFSYHYLYLNWYVENSRKKNRDVEKCICTHK